MSDDTQHWGNPSPGRKPFAVMETLRRYASLSSLLRTLGAGILVASVSMFLFKGWASSDDIQRYVMLLAQTLVLAGTGLVVGRWVGESKGARLFLSLALVAGVVNFAVLGGLIYSQFQWDQALTFYPQFARWQAGSPGAALTTAGIAWAMLVPVAWISFMALARRSASRMTLLFMLSGSTLLLPLRETAYIAVLAGAITAVLLYQVLRAKRADNTLATPEGLFARCMVFAPPVILVGRGMYLYGMDFIMLTAVSALVLLVLRQLARDPQQSLRTRTVLNRLSVLPVITAAFGATGMLADARWLDEALYIPVFALTGAGLLLEISLRAPAGGAGYRRVAGIAAALGMLSNLWIFPGVPSALVSTLVGLIITVLAYSDKQRFVFGAGIATFLAGVAYHCLLAFEAFDLGSWSTLAVIGILAILSGSILERHGAVITARLSNWRRSFQDWGA